MRFQISLAELESLVTRNTRLIVITNLHNPSGVLIDTETMKQIGEIARRAGARVLVDEVYMETLFEESPRTAFHLGNEFVVTSSLTKAFGLSGLRCGWIFAEPDARATNVVAQRSLCVDTRACRRAIECSRIAAD